MATFSHLAADETQVSTCPFAALETVTSVKVPTVVTGVYATHLAEPVLHWILCPAVGLETDTSLRASREGAVYPALTHLAVPLL